MAVQQITFGKRSMTDGLPKAEQQFNLKGLITGTANTSGRRKFVWFCGIDVAANVVQYVESFD